MKLYYSPGACSLSPHIVAKEAGLDIELSKVTFGAEGRTTDEGENFYEVNPRGGYVPALRLDSGQVLTEGVAIIQYLADQSTEPLTPEKGSIEYYHMLEWLTYTSSEIHKGFSPLYRPGISDTEKEPIIAKLISRYEFIDAELKKHPYLIGDRFTIADAYLYTIMRWNTRFSIDLSPFPNIQAFITRMEEREGVKSALTEEGIDRVAL